jgi:lipopolysaccharide transport system ATP-binding protein
MAPIVVFDNVSKKFRRGERHTSFRDLVPSLVRRVFRPEPRDVLGTEEFWALRNVSFDVAPGEALGIIGANGAGKSTTLKILTRILRPNGGACRVAGRIGALIEVAAGFHPDLTGRENVFLQGAIMGMKRREIQQRFDEIVDFAGVADYMDTPVKRYSSGMNARLGFSIAAHLRPDVLIVDEVLSVGDMAFQERCFQRMLQFRRDGIAIVLVSHNLQAVASLCQRSILLAGRVKASGPTIDVLAAQDGAEGTHVNVAPGTRVRLRVAATTSRPLDDVCFGFVLHRSTDQFMVYDGNFQRRELTDADFLGEFRLDLEFCANLVRGHYYLSWHVYDNPTQTYLLPKRQVATLTVHESRSQGGVADVGLTAALQVHARASRPDNRRGNVAIR